ncbi:acyl-CoA thioesterase [Undibacterium terreum]|uniref:Acyl-CoA thioesterase n=1 Tax=Undibacterium terreum TaxID=1224302 RepID=A0A916XCE6_9BURK|nr:thioesterase family protein [Undibacterium terreum]GGC61529.1 acyl-CoA thioesterase [Undibacterium terreum]
METAVKTSDAAQPAHALDIATAVQRQQDGSFAGSTSAAYGNMVGPFGGVTAATLLQSVMQHPDRLGEPVALTVNFAGPLADGEFTMIAEPVRTNRSTQHWLIRMLQAGATAATATVVTATRRDTWSATELRFPDVPSAAAIERTPPLERAAWTAQYDMRFVRGGPGADGKWAMDAGAGAEPDSVSQLWIRDEPARTLDFISLAAICDAFYPRLFVRRPKWVPVGTVSLTTYFHADSAALAACGTDALLGCARALNFSNGYFDQTAEVWSAAGQLLATSHQVVYYKE